MIKSISIRSGSKNSYNEKKMKSHSDLINIENESKNQLNRLKNPKYLQIIDSDENINHKDISYSNKKEEKNEVFWTEGNELTFKKLPKFENPEKTSKIKKNLNEIEDDEINEENYNSNNKEEDNLSDNINITNVNNNTLNRNYKLSKNQIPKQGNVSIKSKSNSRILKSYNNSLGEINSNEIRSIQETGNETMKPNFADLKKQNMFLRLENSKNLSVIKKLKEDIKQLKTEKEELKNDNLRNNDYIIKLDKTIQKLQSDIIKLKKINFEVNQKLHEYKTQNDTDSQNPGTKTNKEKEEIDKIKQELLNLNKFKSKIYKLSKTYDEQNNKLPDILQNLQQYLRENVFSFPVAPFFPFATISKIILYKT